MSFLGVDRNVAEALVKSRIERAKTDEEKEYLRNQSECDHELVVSFHEQIMVCECSKCGFYTETIGKKLYLDNTDC